MTRARGLLFLLAAFVLFVPAVHAQGTVELTEIRILDTDGDELRIAPVDGFLRIEVTMNNSGSTTIDGPLFLNLTVENVDGTYVRYANLTRPGPVTPGNTTVFTYSWSQAGRTIGEYRVTARMTSPTAAEGLVATFSVAETGVQSGNIVDRTLSYYWVFGLFLFAIILFFVVMAARRS